MYSWRFCVCLGEQLVVILYNIRLFFLTEKSFWNLVSTDGYTRPVQNKNPTQDGSTGPKPIVHVSWPHLGSISPRHQEFNIVLPLDSGHVCLTIRNHWLSGTLCQGFCYWSTLEERPAPNDILRLSLGSAMSEMLHSLGKKQFRFLGMNPHRRLLPLWVRLGGSVLTREPLMLREAPGPPAFCSSAVIWTQFISSLCNESLKDKPGKWACHS